MIYLATFAPAQLWWSWLREWEQYLAAAPSQWLIRGASEKCITSLIQVGQDHSTILLSTHSLSPSLGAESTICWYLRASTHHKACFGDARLGDSNTAVHSFRLLGTATCGLLLLNPCSHLATALCVTLPCWLWLCQWAWDASLQCSGCQLVRQSSEPPWCPMHTAHWLLYAHMWLVESDWV